MTAREVLINFFQLPQSEIIFQDYGCALKKGVLSHGRMFVCENYLCFYANILGIKTKVVINIGDITSMEKQKHMGFIQNAIEITTKDGKKYFFCSFTNRDSVYLFLNALWRGQPVNFIPEVDQEEIPKEFAGTLDLALTSADVEVNFLNSNSEDQQQELMQATFPVTLDKFFDFFISDDAIYSLADHRKTRNDFEINLSKWSEESQRELNGVIRLNDVPFKDRTRIYKLQTYKRQDNMITLQSMSKTPDVPFASSFQLEEKWEVIPVEGDPTKCLLRAFGSVVFLKSVYMKKTISSRTIASVKEDLEIYMNGMKKKLETLNKPAQPQEQQPSLYHDYEESKTMEDKLVVEKPRRQSQVQKPLETTKDNKLTLIVIVMLGFMILLQLLQIILFLRIDGKLTNYTPPLQQVSDL